MTWGFLWLMLALKLPLAALIYLVWWAIKQEPEDTSSTDDDGGIKRQPRPHPRKPFPRPPAPRSRTATRRPRRPPACAPPAPAPARSGTERALQPPPRPARAVRLRADER